MTELPLHDQPRALALISTVLGAARDSVACERLEAVTGHAVHSVRVESLFADTEGHAEDG